MTTLTTLTGNKNTDALVFSKLSDKHLKKWANFGVCQDDSFWKARFHSRFGQIPWKLPHKSWKIFYYQVVDNQTCCRHCWRGLFRIARGSKNQDVADFFIANKIDAGAIMEAARISAKGGHRDMVDFFIVKSLYLDWDHDVDKFCIDIALSAMEGGNYNMAIDFIEKLGRISVYLGKRFIYTAAKKGSRKMVNYLLDKGVRVWNSGLYGAMAGGHKNMLDCFIRNGANVMNQIVYEDACRHGRMYNQHEMIYELNQSVAFQKRQEVLKKQYKVK